MKTHILTLFTICLLGFQWNLYAQDNTKGSSEAVYKGRKKKGIPHGYGSCTWPDGRKYEGGWKEGLMSGEGTMNYPNGDRYVGEWSKGIKNGRGTYLWKNGDKYIGGYQDGKRRGWGVLRFANGDSYEGYWKQDLASGEGTFKWNNGDYYVGEWKNNLRHGEGTMVYADGGLQQGEWENGEYQPCQCDRNPTVDEAFATSDIVVSGRVMSIEPGEGDNRLNLVRLKVTEYWKGDLGLNGVLLLSAGKTSCDFIYFIDGEYLLFLKKTPAFTYTTTKCSPSGDRFFKELEALRLNEIVDCEGEASPAYFSNGIMESVCGCDGNTYPSARKAAQSGVKRWKLGKCEK